MMLLIHHFTAFKCPKTKRALAFGFRCAIWLCRTLSQSQESLRFSLPPIFCFPAILKTRGIIQIVCFDFVSMMPSEERS
ncbi:hypothetical protein AAZX31_11G067400 [Glycine max]|uniref:Uncharacterized protein n=2 Tax=Glycine subgen. Soja TaxID=1462606 RepID=A0A0R0HQJ9_SOYBN|nr:hypothetical protein JHK87_030179 [Glycine soja]KAG4987931.1 hypothetical protein JHK85_030914 [Glycine max]KAG4993551.1 hypothetical protein JHK86_030378 [Glycine max]KAG5123547.1 hypothetical protein JHK82_030284 [Glycine max]KAG5144971.1 hypothetical protein JHK84_030514 [Glycine max]